MTTNSLPPAQLQEMLEMLEEHSAGRQRRGSPVHCRILDGATPVSRPTRRLSSMFETVPLRGGPI
jgi:hypothetical protein